MLSCQLRGVTEWFGWYGNDVNHMLWPSLSPHLDTTEDAREILERKLKQWCPPLGMVFTLIHDKNTYSEDDGGPGRNA